MITDKTIDESTAKYWCIFSDKKIQRALKNMKVVKEDVTRVLNNMNQYAGYLFTAIGLAGLVGPYLANIWKRAKYDSNHSIATVLFTADGTRYSCEFNLKEQKWILLCDTKIDQHDLISFYETQFFNKFLEQCANYIMPILKSKDSIKKNIKAIKDSNARKLILSMFKYEQKLVDNMFKGKYMT